MSLKSMARAGVRWLLWPVWKRFWLRFDIRIAPLRQHVVALDGRLDQMSADLQEVENRPVGTDDRVAARLDAFDTAWRQHVPALLNATSRATAASGVVTDLHRRIELIEARQEQARAEYGSLVRAVFPGGTPADGAIPLRPLDRYAGEAELRLLFLGPGAQARAGYVSVAAAEAPGVDILSSGTGLPFAHGRVAEIMADRFLQTVDPGHWRRAVLPHWRSLLRPNGTLHLRFPNPEALLREVASGHRAPSTLRDDLAEADAILLHWPESLRDSLEAAGFRLAGPGESVAASDADNLPMIELTAIRP